MAEAGKPTFLLDSGPLSVLCSFPLRGAPYIERILHHINILLPDGVIREAGKGKIQRIVSPLIKREVIKSVVTSDKPQILDVAYSKYLGEGERSVIKAALLTELPCVIDDYEAFVVACRFGLRPMVFQDFVVKLVKEHGMPKTTAVEIVKGTAPQFRAMFLTHTLEMLG